MLGGELREAGIASRASGWARRLPNPPGSPGAWDEPGLDASARGSLAHVTRPRKNKRCFASSGSNRAVMNVSPHRNAQAGGGQHPWGTGSTRGVRAWPGDASSTHLAPPRCAVLLAAAQKERRRCC